MPEVNCPVNNCDECEFNRTESWCSQALPHYDGPSKLYKVRMEGFWEALNWAEEHYKWLEDHYEEHNDYICLIVKVLERCYVEGRGPTTEEMEKIDNFWND